MDFSNSIYNVVFSFIYFWFMYFTPLVRILCKRRERDTTQFVLSRYITCSENVCVVGGRGKRGYLGIQRVHRTIWSSNREPRVRIFPVILHRYIVTKVSLSSSCHLGRLLPSSSAGGIFEMRTTVPWRIMCIHTWRVRVVLYGDMWHKTIDRMRR